MISANCHMTMSLIRLHLEKKAPEQKAKVC